MTEHLRVTIDGGKYTVIQPEEGAMYFLRYGEPWSNPGELIRYGKMILAMAYEIDELREAVNVAEAGQAGACNARDFARHALIEAERQIEKLKMAFPRALATSAEREFGEESVRRVVNLDCQNERP